MSETLYAGKPQQPRIPVGKIWLRRRYRRVKTAKWHMAKSKTYTDKEWFERMWRRYCREVDRGSPSCDLCAVAFEIQDGKWVETRRYEGESP